MSHLNCSFASEPLLLEEKIYELFCHKKTYVSKLIHFEDEMAHLFFFFKMRRSEAKRLLLHLIYIK